ncbi:hypothetical protein PHMEG_00014867 [Phytophthora megakarya]|uniref:Uncharacterized protein n=1 Tax=Phytophthora megakarya TaxID=4795 RepID=A0A225W2R3_9STRA|nr:hypothetical protein PHMEG_00014867 [Phytophthora megakarya]
MSGTSGMSGASGGAGYLVQHNSWDVVNGAAAAYPANTRWVERNQFARYALLFGMVPTDFKKVCRMATALEMWTSFGQDKTKRVYASEIRLRRHLYTAKFKPGEEMEKCIERVENMR